MNLYLIGAICVSMLIGWLLGEYMGFRNGYTAALQYLEQQRMRETWSQYFNNFKGGKDEDEENE